MVPYGFDIAKAESEKPEKIKKAIIGDIQKIDLVKSTLTLLGARGIDTGEKMAELIPDIIPEEKKPLTGPAGMDEEDEFDEEDYEEEDFEEKNNSFILKILI